MADYLAHDVRRDAEIQEQRHAGMSEVMEADCPEVGGLPDR